MNDLIFISFYVIFYLMISYAFFVIGEKLNNKDSFWYYLIPFYNMHLLCKGAKISSWLIVGTLLPFIGFLFTGYIFGMIAKRFNRNYWFWGVFVVLGLSFLALPIFILASVGYNKNSDDEVEKFEELKKDKFQIEFLTGEFTGNSMDIPTDGIIIGRESNVSNLVVNSEKVSAKHTRVYLEDNQVIVEDLNSLNGTFIGDIDNGYKKVDKKEYATSINSDFFIVEPELISFKITKV